MCFKCGVYGHRMESCGLQISPSQGMVSPPIHHGGDTRDQGAKEDGPISDNQGVGGGPSDGDVGDLAKEGREKAIHDELGKTPEVDQGAELEMEGKEDVFGSWMLVKRGRKKKGGPPSAPIVRKGRNFEQGRISAEVKGAGCSLVKVGPQKGVVILGGSSAVPSKADDGKQKQSGSLEIYKDQPAKMNFAIGPVGGQVQAQSGGKNSHIGPRIRDAKKAARANGSIKTTFKVSDGPIYQKKKENINPNTKAGEKGNLLGKNVECLTTSQQKTMVIPTQTTCLDAGAVEIMNQDVHMEDLNPLLGFISSSSLAQKPLVIAAETKEENLHGRTPQGTKLSKQKHPTISQ